MTIKEALKEYHKIEIELLLAHVLKKPKEFLYLYPERSLSAYQLISSDKAQDVGRADCLYIGI